jgi:hypothetical protein
VRLEDLPPEAPAVDVVADTFEELKTMQQGRPEDLGTSGLTQIGGRGITQFIAEYTGDLINRMTQRIMFRDTAGKFEVAQKVRHLLSTLTDGYGVGR